MKPLKPVNQRATQTGGRQKYKLGFIAKELNLLLSQVLSGKWYKLGEWQGAGKINLGRRDRIRIRRLVPEGRANKTAGKTRTGPNKGSWAADKLVKMLNQKK